ncbi:hypothetical protein [uncultured Salinisphaera sp.]|uniref:hypothetical protein n=1 Tax=uncultured Salinisphaera sp. TaxID=359372 RepID=UPI0032B161BE|tara:strand:- start:43 stop:381 length:339 start_codon:yes stop_codon:yes gene_type:complete
MTDHDDNRRRSQRLPAWAGYVLIAADTITKPLFWVPWLGTLAAISLALPVESIWAWIGVLIAASLACLVAITRAVAIQASQRGALGAYVAYLATQTLFGRWLTDVLSGSGSR